MLRAFIAKNRSGRISEDTRPDRLRILLSPIFLTDRRVFRPTSLYACVKDLCQAWHPGSECHYWPLQSERPTANRERKNFAQPDWKTHSRNLHNFIIWTQYSNGFTAWNNRYVDDCRNVGFSAREAKILAFAHLHRAGNFRDTDRSQPITTTGSRRI